MSIRTHTVLAAAVAAASVTSAVAVAGADQRDPRQRLTITYRTANGVDDPTTVRARGPINGQGTATQVEGPRATYRMTLALPHGEVRMTAVERDGPFRFDPETCTATFESDGTWRITGGTGRYDDATGQGEFTSRGTIRGARDADGRCLGPGSGAPPAERVDVLELEGVARR